MAKRLTGPQRTVLKRLRAGEHLLWNYRDGIYQLSGGGKVPNVTFRSLEKAGLIRGVGYHRSVTESDVRWVAATKGDGDGR